MIRNLEVCERFPLTNDYGLYFDNDRQFNMPITTGCAAIAEFNYGRLEAGMRFLRMIARTVGYTMPGAAPEYIDANGDPEQADPRWCYLQLWTAALYVEALVLGVLRLEPDAARGKVTMTPRLSKDWPCAEFRNITIGESRISVRVGEEGAAVTHVDGPKLDVRIQE